MKDFFQALLRGLIKIARVATAITVGASVVALIIYALGNFLPRLPYRLAAGAFGELPLRSHVWVNGWGWALILACVSCLLVVVAQIGGYTSEQSPGKDSK